MKNIAICFYLSESMDMECIDMRLVMELDLGKRAFIAGLDFQLVFERERDKETEERTKKRVNIKSRPKQVSLPVSSRFALSQRPFNYAMHSTFCLCHSFIQLAMKVAMLYGNYPNFSIKILLTINTNVTVCAMNIA